MYKNCYDQEALLYVQERQREEVHRQLIRQASAGRKPAYASLLAAVGHWLTRTGERLQAEPQTEVPEHGDMLLTH